MYFEKNTVNYLYFIFIHFKHGYSVQNIMKLFRKISDQKIYFVLYAAKTSQIVYFIPVVMQEFAINVQ